MAARRARRSSAAASGGPEQDLSAAGVRLLPGDAGRQVQERGEPLEVERSWRRPPGGVESGERVDSDGIDGARQRERRQIRVHLEGKRLDVPLERVRARPHRLRRMRARVVKLTSERHENKYGGRKMPRSVMIAVIREAGVTSKAGLNTGG